MGLVATMVLCGKAWSKSQLSYQAIPWEKFGHQSTITTLIPGPLQNRQKPTPSHPIPHANPMVFLIWSWNGLVWQGMGVHKNVLVGRLQSDMILMQHEAVSWEFTYGQATYQKHTG